MDFKIMEDFRAFTDLSRRCYPGMKLHSKEEQERYTEHRREMAQKEDIHTIGLYEREQLVGGYIAYDHVMNVYGQQVQAGGIGTVAVDLPYKKQGHAKRIIQHFLGEARDKGQTIAHLYPFQPSFYKRMGFGVGPRLSTYQFHPSQLPSYNEGETVAVLNAADQDEVKACYDTWAKENHGATVIPPYGFAFLEKEELHTFGVREEGKLTGYVTLEFKEGDHFLQNDVHVKNFFHTTIKAYRALIQYLHNQKDQVRSIYFPTFDQDFAYSLNDPVHVDEQLIFSIYHKVSEEGRGLMYRILDIPAFLEKLVGTCFGTDTVKVGWKVSDSFLNETYEAVWQFTNGKPVATHEEAEVSIEIDIAHFSSLMMGCVSLSSLLRSGAADSNGRAIDLFQYPDYPKSWTFF
ncbi:enhanced intracellular survival protein Eis [Halobacillus sp. Nhm2S1]|uniref:GNAT family N-acetyltransferase n=1 Tax=Halobacillus sp. Nhm2S1 TaxID=2866716 RepID=UPI001C730615|nr:GNAT family N-acetyltransferase [Halobacillus sp. Nhm2S1]MBX0359367.1 GNAT family N-acetyltransferase [Halobacillus sp. Nhm2S1]